MSEMIERVARAIFKSGMHFANMGGEVFETAIPRHREICYRQARAVIEAMREPTKKMADAGQYADLDETYGDGGYTAWMSEETAIQAWQLMIDAALAEEPQP